MTSTSTARFYTTAQGAGRINLPVDCAKTTGFTNKEVVSIEYDKGSILVKKDTPKEVPAV